MSTLLDAITSGDSVQVAASLLAATEADRRSIAPHIRKTFHAIRTSETGGTPQQRLASLLALLGTATLGELGDRGFEVFPSADEADTVLTFLKALRPAWLEKWAGEICERTPHRWHFARRLIREGLSEVPSTPAYTLGMFSPSFCPPGYDRTPRNVLLDDPALLEDEVWRLFEHEGSGELSLAAHDKYSPEHNTWATALRTLAAEGRLDRQRLLDACLNALERDYAQFRAGWFSRFHQLLEPTPIELSVRANRYARLLGSKIPPTVSFALEVLESLAKENKLSVATLREDMRPALMARAAGTVLRALALSARVLREDPDLPRLAAIALGHESADVQRVALDLIDAQGQRDDSALRTRVEEVADSVAPSLRARVKLWLGQSSPEATTATTIERNIVLAKRSERITPIGTAEELIDRLSFVLENPGEIDEIERALDATRRLSATVPTQIAQPLVKRARTLLAKTERARPVTFELARVALAWAKREVHPRSAPESDEAKVADFLRGRLDALVQAIASGEEGTLLSAPTHRGGTISPRTWVDRLRTTTTTPDDWDLVLSLLRLGQEERAQALLEAREIPGELGAIARHALGAANQKVGTNAAWWAAAARARDATSDDPAVLSAHPNLGAGAGHAVTLTPRIFLDEHRIGVDCSPSAPEQPSPLHLSVLLHAQRKPSYDSDVDEEPMRRWAMSLWPSWREPMFAEGIEAVSANLDWWEARWADRAYLEPLLDSATPFTPLARTLLVLALAAKQPAISSLAVDALVAGVSDGRARTEEVGESMWRLLCNRTIEGARWAKSLSQVAQVSRAHTEWVVRTLVRAMRGNPAYVPKDMGKLLEAWSEWMIEVGGRIEDPEARQFLGGITVGGKTAKAVHALLSA